MFHGGINEMIKENLPGADFMPLSYLPKNFDYYAGGHMHKFSDESYPDYTHVVYPGTLFSGHPIDFIDNAKGQQRGFVLVEFEKEIQKTQIIYINLAAIKRSLGGGQQSIEILQKLLFLLLMQQVELLQ